MVSDNGLLCRPPSPCKPRLLLADEPTSQLSDDDRDQMLGLIHQIGADLGTTVVVTHDPEVSATFRRTVTIKSGRVGLARGA